MRNIFIVTTIVSSVILVLASFLFHVMPIIYASFIFVGVLIANAIVYTLKNAKKQSEVKVNA